MNKTPTLPSFIGLLLAAGAAQAQLTIPNADGSDGAFVPTENIEVDLGLAITATWGTPGTGNGVYDSNKWAVVFKYESVNIASGVTVTFKNHPSRCPVVWLVSGDCRIDGTVNLDGKYKFGVTESPEPGPGGYRAGYGGHAGEQHGAGFGPISQRTGFNGLSGLNWGNRSGIPLYGANGSYAVTSNGNWNKGAGGGAIAICCSGTFSMNGGNVTARGGVPSQFWQGDRNANGGAGLIRVVAHRYAGSGHLWTDSGQSGHGICRIEFAEYAGYLLMVPSVANVAPTNPVKIFPDDAADPHIEILSIDGQDSPADPRARMDPPSADLSFNKGSGNYTVIVQTKNVPVDATVVVRAVQRHGNGWEAPAAHTTGTAALSTWTASIPYHTGFTTLIARVETQ